MPPTPSSVFCDFEYRSDGQQLIVGCFLHHPSGVRTTIDFRQPSGIDELRRYQALHANATWFSYSATAEITCFLTAGLSVAAMQWVCLMVEAKQVTGSHTRFYSRKAGLLHTLQAFEIQTRGSVSDKESTISLILSTDTYSQDQWAKIVDYCWSDLEPLPELWQAIQAVHSLAGKPFAKCAAIFRAEYLKATSKLEYRSRGFPVDVPLLNRIYSNQKLLRRKVAEWTNEHYGAKLFRYNKLKDQYSFHFEGLEKHIATLDFPVHWERTPSGRLRMDGDYLDTFARKNVYFEPLQKTKMLLDQLKTSDLRELEQGGFIKGVSLPFHTITGRNQPLTKRGFMLNLPPWLRFIVRPAPGHVLIAADWSQQEMVLACALSGDRQLKAALETGDVYLALAKMSGAAPPDATKSSHKTIRDVFKTVQLGVGYGMGVASLGLRLYLNALHTPNAMSLEEATDKAETIMRWHKATFTDYWQFVAREVNLAKQRGWIRAKDGWTLFADEHTRFTMLQNFHMQSNGAVILREALKILAADYPEVEFVCSLHDAIYLYCAADDVDIHTNILRRVMQEATRRVMATLPLPMPISVGVEVYDHAGGYGVNTLVEANQREAPKGADMFRKILSMLDAEGV